MFLKKILKIKSLSYCEEYIYKKIIFYLKIFNFEIIKIRFVSNLLFLKNKKKIFIGHLDIVNEGYLNWITLPYKSNFLKKNIINRGIIDMKGSIISFFFFIKNNFLLTNDEESFSIYGIQYVINILFLKKKFFYFFLGGEPTSFKIIGDNIKISRRGSFNFNLIFIGKQKHVAYLGENVIVFFLKKINFFLKKPSKKDNFEISNLFSGINVVNLTPNKLFIKVNYRFVNFYNIIIIKKKIIKNFKKKNIYLKWYLSGLPFICYKNFFLKKIINVIKKLQLINTNINFLGGISDLRYCYQFYKNSNLFELGLINKSIHKTNENSFFDDLIILSIIYMYFFIGIR